MELPGPALPAPLTNGIPNNEKLINTLNIAIRGVWEKKRWAIGFTEEGPPPDDRDPRPLRGEEDSAADARFPEDARCFPEADDLRRDSEGGRLDFSLVDCPF